ncbi:MAG: hypothetical protein AAF985_00050 [Bacteroidota bacterium]
MNISQKINHIQDQQYDDDITVSGVPTGFFLAVTNMTFPQGSTTREITLDLMPLEQQQDTTLTTNSGLYTRQNDETAIKVTVMQDGTMQAENTQNY